jgi:TRAP-type C4-dicarboxylate transport system substrate-binding protein
VSGSLPKWVAVFLLLLLALGLSVRVTQTSAKSEYRMKVVAISRAVPQWELWQFFKNEVERRSNGRIAIELTTVGELGVATFDMIRILRSGLIDVGDVIPLHVSGEVPLFEGTELPGIFPDVPTNRKAIEAWTERLLVHNVDRMGGRVLGSYGWAGQMMFSRKSVEKLAELKGMKIRVTSRSMSDYVSFLKGEPVTIAFSELYPGLHRGTVDGATTGAASGYGLKLYEVTKYLVDLNIGTPIGLLVVSKPLWQRLPVDLQQLLIEVGKKFTDRGWTLSLDLEEKGINQLKAKGVTYIPVKPEWRAELKKAREHVAKKWVERAGTEGKLAFNQILSPYTGFTIK